MANKEEQVRLLLRRIKENRMVAGDGQSFMEYLEELSRENYIEWKRHAAEYDQFHKGYAFAVDSLIESFATCSKRKQKSSKGDEALAFT